MLSDPERKAIEGFDVWQEKKNYGKVSMGVVRSSFVVDENGCNRRCESQHQGRGGLPEGPGAAGPMNIQIFGVTKSADTRKAERYFKERRTNSSRWI